MDKYEGNSKALMWFVALVLTGVVAGCGGGGGGGPTLTVPPGAGAGVGGLGVGPAPVDLGMAGSFVILALWDFAGKGHI